MTPDVATGFLIILIVILTSSILAPLLVWVLPERTHPKKV